MLKGSLFLVFIVYSVPVETQTPPSSGLYFILDETLYLPGDFVVITSIGSQPSPRSYSGSTLVCVTTNVNTQCCRNSDGGNVGEWYYPDGRIVFRSSDAAYENFARFGYTHEIRLSAVSGIAMGPTGSYRCVIPDERGVNVSASINLVIPLLAPTVLSITKSPSYIFAGISFYLTCSIQLTEELPNNFTLQVIWTDSFGSDTTSEPVRLGNIYYSTIRQAADATLNKKKYTCHATYRPINHFIATDVARSFGNIDITVHHPSIISFIKGFPTDINFFTGLELNLTCFINISHIPESLVQNISVTTTWTKSNTPIILNNQRNIIQPYQIGLFQYQTSIIFNSLDKIVDEGEYTCDIQVTINQDGANANIRNTITRTVTIPSIFFQLQIGGISDCNIWKSNNAAAKNSDISSEIVTIISSSCGCDISTTHLTDRAFICDSSSNDFIIYQAQLHGTLQANVSQIADILQQWVKDGHRFITVQLSVLSIRNFCVISMGYTLPCGTIITTGFETSTINDGWIAGGLIISITFIVLVTVIPILSLVLLKKMKYKLNIKAVPRLQDIPPENTTFVQYEDIEKYQTKDADSKDGKEIQISGCPAYDKVDSDEKSCHQEEYEAVKS